ncbi:MAG TPA: hypothetical protein VGO85_00960 [Caldimonas sp.]|jgi:uncharacterized membrane protein|nr:hypothetical protein [Caldimonas sp.]
MNLIRIVVTGLVAGAAAWATLPASAQTKKAPAKEVIEPAVIAKPDQADLDRSQIIGNRELPKVTYIVPWKKPGAGDLTGRPLVSVLDEALAPVDREVFRRQIRYDAQAVAQVPAGAAPAAPAAPTK